MNFVKSIVFMFLAQCAISTLYAGPTSLFWTNCTTAVLDTGTLHLNVDNYFSVFNRRGHGESFPPDVGFTYGLFTWNNIKAEAGFDYFGGADNPWTFNSKMGVPENALFCHAPSLSLGMFDIGTRCRGKHATNQNVVDLIIGKSLPDSVGGIFYVAGFSGGRAMGKNRQGFMVGFERTFCPAMYCDGTEYHKLKLEIDYASGKNTIGGGGVGIAYYFTPGITLLTGPVFFNDAKINGSWKWSVQLFINTPLFKGSDLSGSEN
jgi:hypothetical protein